MQAPKPGQVKRIAGLVGDAWLYELAELVRQSNTFHCVILPDNTSVEQASETLKFWLPEHTVLRLPDWETLPYDAFSPHPDIIAERIGTLYRLPQLTAGVLLLPVSTLMQRLPPKSYILGRTFHLKVGHTIAPAAFCEQLVYAGYERVNQVYQPGEFAQRGAIIDFFPSGYDAPIRIDLFDDEVETIRRFDPDTQRTTNHIDEIKLLPAHEFPTDDAALTQFRQRWRSLLPVSRNPESIYQQVSQGQLPQGIEYYFPLFFEHTSSLTDYLPEASVWVEVGDCDQAFSQLWEEIRQRYAARKESEARPPLPPEMLFLRDNEYFAELKRRPRWQLQQGASDKAHTVTRHYRTLPDITLDHRARQRTHRLQDWLTRHQHPVIICTESLGRAEQVAEWLTDIDRPIQRLDDWPNVQQVLKTPDVATLVLTVCSMSQGFIHPDGWAVVAENAFYGDKVRVSESKPSGIDPDKLIRDLAELTPGAPVVHYEHGVARYLGLTTLTADGQTQEFLTLEFAEHDKLYVPVHNLHLLSRFSATEESAVTLSKLGNDTWSKTRAKAAEKIRDVAAELLDVYAQRAAQPGFSHQPDGDDLQLFAASFPFEETPDQQKAIDEVLNDLARPYPMDRLVCGDVGFGKTEVAMRAAFAVTNAGRQVAVLVPTTLLAQQHYETFIERFTDWPVRIELLSRFRASRQQQKTLEGLASGEVDIVIGTHKLVQKDIDFARLGLVIIDEEHRFGVHQKEHLKRKQPNVDILAMTATPIPRSLNLALSGLRDLSIIATPPAHRLSVKTFIRPNDSLLVKDAIQREIRRGGQVFVVHNDIKTIVRRAEEIRNMLPGLRVAVAHGQMRELELERIMQDFYHHRYQVLVCTTIIETGIDIPTANTLIVDRADHFGLAQLHQLRGRVGRSHHQAYAYLLIPESKQLMTKDAQRRLEAIEKMDQLGSGFLLAQQDLEIRGAGEILGEEQSGQIERIGYSLYMDMLDRAVKALKSGEQPSLDVVIRAHAEVDLQVSAILPEDYVPDVSERLTLYKRIASTKNEHELDALKVELIDRFGLLPEPTKMLFRVTRLRQRAEALGIRQLSLGREGGKILFSEQPKFDPYVLIQMMQARPDRYRMRGSHHLQILGQFETPDKRIHFAERLINRLEEGTGKD